MSEKSSTQDICARAKAALPSLSVLPPEKIEGALLNIADGIESSAGEILSANAKDVAAAKGSISDVMLDRLMLDRSRIYAMADGVRKIAALPSSVGRVLERKERPNGLIIEKVSIPIGVIAIIYESRPNVTSDAAALALKSANACILRGGKEAYRTSYEIVKAMKTALRRSGISEDVIGLVSDTTRNSAYELMSAKGLIDLLIPRGGAGLINACVENAKVPCLQTGTGICHIYVDKAANEEMALSVIENAKTSRPSVCNAEEVLLVHKDIAKSFLPALKKRLVDERAERGEVPVELKLDSEALKIISGTPAGEDDFDTEFLDYKLAVGVVSNIDGAILHIALHSTHHSDAIITDSAEAADHFTSLVDSAAVYVNASTRFTDGGEFGLGCEMGISTQRLHARGPVGINELTTYKYIIKGNGQIR